MSTTAKSGTMKAGSPVAPFFIGFMAMTAAALVAQSARMNFDWHRWEFVALALAGAVSSRFKVKLPGLNGNMSVNLPFIFIALTRLSMVEAMVVATLSVFIQSIPKAPHKFVPVQVLFNLSTATVAAGLGWNAFHFASASHFNPAASLVLGCGMHLLASTMPVAVIIALTDNRACFKTWSDIFHLSFPYYLASTGLASIAAAVGAHTSSPMIAGFACVMFVTYRSYRMYFTSMQADLANRATTNLSTSAAAGK